MVKCIEEENALSEKDKNTVRDWLCAVVADFIMGPVRQLDLERVISLIFEESMERKSSIYLNKGHESKLGLRKRNGRSEAINIIGDRYITLVIMERRNILVKFSVGECNVLWKIYSDSSLLPAEDMRIVNSAHMCAKFFSDIFEMNNVIQVDLETKGSNLSDFQQFTHVEEIEDWRAKK